MTNLQNQLLGRLFSLAASGSCSSWNHPTVGNLVTPYGTTFAGRKHVVKRVPGFVPKRAVRMFPFSSKTSYSGGRTGAGFYARSRSLKLTDVRELPLEKVRSFDWHNIMHDLVLAELPPPKELRYTQNGDLNASVITLSGNLGEEKRGVKWRIRSRYVRFAPPEHPLDPTIRNPCWPGPMWR